jgi:hypothetical protein
MMRCPRLQWVAVRVSIRIYEGVVALFLGCLYVLNVVDHFGLLFLFAASKRTIAQKRQNLINRTNDCLGVEGLT